MVLELGNLLRDTGFPPHGPHLLHILRLEIVFKKKKRKEEEIYPTEGTAFIQLDNCTNKKNSLHAVLETLLMMICYLPLPS